MWWAMAITAAEAATEHRAVFEKCVSAEQTLPLRKKSHPKFFLILIARVCVPIRLLCEYVCLC